MNKSICLCGRPSMGVTPTWIVQASTGNNAIVDRHYCRGCSKQHCPLALYMQTELTAQVIKESCRYEEGDDKTREASQDML